ncbi:MAG: hypothetical protein WD851_23515, partial [Pirellulales bacterium]
DNVWSHTTTTRAGGDAEGHASLSQSTVEKWTNDYHKQLDNHTDNGASGWSHHQETDTTRDAGHNSQTATVSGPEENRRHTLAIDSAFESWVDNESSDTLYTATTFRRTGNVTHDEKSGSSSYQSSHLTNATGLARDGKFSSSSTNVESHSTPIPTESSYYYNHVYNDAVVTDDRNRSQGGHTRNLENVEYQLSRDLRYANNFLVVHFA